MQHNNSLGHSAPVALDCAITGALRFAAGRWVRADVTQPGSSLFPPPCQAFAKALSV